MNDTHQVLVYADDVNLIGDDIRTIERNANVLLNTCKHIGLSVNTGKTKYMEIGRHRGMILRRILGLKRDVNAEWRRYHNEELHNLYRSPNIVRTIKSIKLRGAGHLARMEEGRRVLKFKQANL